MNRILKASRLLLVGFLVLTLAYNGIDPLGGMAALFVIMGVEIYFLSKKERKVSNLPLICVLSFCGSYAIIRLALAPQTGPAAVVVFIPMILIFMVLPTLAYVVFALYDLSGKFDPDPVDGDQ